MAKSIHTSITALFCALIALGGSAIGYALKEGRTNQPALVGSTASVRHEPASALAKAIRGCRGNDLEACARVAARLETLFAGGDASAGADRTLARSLAQSAVVVIRDRASRDHGAVDASLARCSANERDACERIAAVLTGLFTGTDAYLDASPDRGLARGFAARLLAVAGDSDDKPMAARPLELRR